MSKWRRISFACRSIEVEFARVVRSSFSNRIALALGCVRSCACRTRTVVGQRRSRPFMFAVCIPINGVGDRPELAGRPASFALRSLGTRSGEPAPRRLRTFPHGFVHTGGPDRARLTACGKAAGNRGPACSFVMFEDDDTARSSEQRRLEPNAHDASSRVAPLECSYGRNQQLPATRSRATTPGSRASFTRP